MRLFLFLLCCVYFGQIRAQEYAIGGNWGQQLIFEDNDTVIHDFMWGADISILANREESTLAWTKFYHIRHVQYGFIFQNLEHLRGFTDPNPNNFTQGNIDGLGKMYGLYAAPHISFLKFSSPINLYLNPGFGICYVSKHYYLDKRIRYIGSHLNFFVKGEVGFQIRMNEKQGIFLGGMFAHFSNGAMQLPNAGVNQMNFILRYYHRFQ
jgi:hypothetical protein